MAVAVVISDAWRIRETTVEGIALWDKFRSI